MYQTAQTIYVWIKSDDGKKVESYRVQGWIIFQYTGKYYPVIFDEIMGIRKVDPSEASRFSLDERDQQPLMIRSSTPSTPSAPTAAVNIASLPTDPNARAEFETEHSRRVKANALPHEQNTFREGLVDE